MKTLITVALLALSTLAQASGTCYSPPPITRPGTTAICVCDARGFNCTWMVVSTRY